MTGKEGDHIELLSQEFVGWNQARRQGFASFPPGSAAALSENQTLMINAAIMNHRMEATNAPWKVELVLPVEEPSTSRFDHRTEP